jgi:hypothetical protein
MANYNLKGYCECISGYKMSKMLANLNGFWLFHSQLTSPIPPSKNTITQVQDVIMVWSILAYFSQVQQLWLWVCGAHLVILQPALTSFRPCPEPFIHLMEFPWASSSFFLLAKVVQIGVNEKGHNLSHLLAERKPWKV